VYPFLNFMNNSPWTVLRQDGSVSGFTRIEGVLTKNVEVWLLWRPTMVPLERTYSDANGAYHFNNVPADTPNLVVYFKDPAGGTVYNDIVKALITAA